jgi:hypothetical protein
LRCGEFHIAADPGCRERLLVAWRDPDAHPQEQIDCFVQSCGLALQGLLMGSTAWMFVFGIALISG